MENRKDSLRTVSNTELWIKETGKEAARVPFVNGIARAGGVCVRMCEESDGTVVPVLSVDDEVSLDYAEIRYRFRKCFLTGDVRMFNNATSTNDIVTVERCNRQTKIKIKDVIVLRNMDRDQTVTLGFVTAHRFYTWVYYDWEGVSFHYELEDKPVFADRPLTLERFFVSEADWQTALADYADRIAVYNHTRPLKDIPVGFCSWSCYFSDVTEERILRASDMLCDRLDGQRANLVQIDDGWQKSRPFCGIWETDTERFPNGMRVVSDHVHRNGQKFGLWLAPFLIGENSEHYKALSDMVRMDEVTMNGVHPFDLDNPAFFRHLYTTFRDLTEKYKVDYYKIDFIAATVRHFTANAREAVRFRSDYCVALLRKAMQTVRDAVGDEVVLLSCGAPILECAGIFDAQRVSCDIIWGKAETNPSYWEIMKGAASTILRRWFYHGVDFCNDPDGIVVRDWDRGDGYNCTYSEAKLWAVTVAMSGGSVLHNEELENLSPARRKLIIAILPPTGVAGRPLDLFELPYPSAALARIDENTCYLALYNWEDQMRKISFDLSLIGAQDYTAYKFFSGRRLSVGKIPEQLLNPHDAELYVLKKELSATPKER